MSTLFKEAQLKRPIVNKEEDYSPFVDVISSDEKLFESRAKEGKFDNIEVGSAGDKGFKMDRQGAWWGQNEFTGAPSTVDMDGTNNFTSGGSFTDLSGTPSAFVTANALYRVNNTPNGIEESDTTIDDYTANKLVLTIGTSIFEMDDCDLTFSDDISISAAFDVTAICTIDQNIAKAQAPEWGGINCKGSLKLSDADNRQIIMGASEDACIYYDGTDLIIDPDAVGSGKCIIGGSLQATDYYSGDGSQGLSAAYTFGGGGSGDIASMTFKDGLITAVTLVP